MEYGAHYQLMKLVEMMFVTCCVLRNMLVDESETEVSTVRVGRGVPLEGGAIYLEGQVQLCNHIEEGSSNVLSN